MNIAEKKKQTNIAEYIIHMYQTEDLIRAFDCDMEKVKEYVLKHIPQAEKDKSELTSWYVQVLNNMREENILKKGHLTETENIIRHLELLKEALLAEDEEFKKVYTSAAPYIKEMIQLSQGEISSDIQICFNGIYGLLLAKINGRDIPEELKTPLEHFGNVLSFLTYKYHQGDYMSHN